jgi:hypothetical protein
MTHLLEIRVVPEQISTGIVVGKTEEMTILTAQISWSDI